jgi:conjugal transfer pilus assembly protein TrbC
MSLAGLVQGSETSNSDTVASDKTRALVEQAKEQSQQDITESETVKKAMEKAREQAKTMTIPENKHKEAGQKAAEETNAVYRSQEFQDKIKRCENWENVVFGGKKAKKEQEAKGILADSEKIFLFLSSSIPEASFSGYMASLDGVPEIVPVMKGIVGGLSKENKKERLKWWRKVLKKDSTCKEPETHDKSPCDLIKPSVAIKPQLFRQYEITEVPALVYVRGDDIYQIQGDVGLNTLLEKVNQEAKSPGMNALIIKTRGGGGK